MNADKPCVRIHKIELDVPALSRNHVDGDRRIGMVPAPRMIVAGAAPDQLRDGGCGDLAGHQFVLGVDLIPGFMQK